MNLYTELKEAGIEIDNHSSDLYFPVTAASTAILLKYETHFKNAQRFVHTIKQEPWYDVPFAFEPFWEMVVNKSHTSNPTIFQFTDTGVEVVS